LDLEIGPAVATRYSLMARGISDPDEWTFQPYSTTRIRGDGRSVGFGNPTASWGWNFLSQDQLNALLRLFTNTDDSSVTTHIQTYQDNGLGLSDMVGTYECIMHRPVDGDGKTLINESTFPVYSDVTVRFTRLVAE
jgi:hypothetical protein